MKLVVVAPSENFNRADPIPGIAAELGERDFEAASLAEFQAMLSSDGELETTGALIGVDHENDELIESVEEVVRDSAARDVRVLLVTAGVTPATIHRLMQAGAVAFVPWPFPDGALEAGLENLRPPPPPPPPVIVSDPAGPGHSGRIITILHNAGGAGASTLAINLAWEMRLEAEESRRIALIDFDFQNGAVACALDLNERGDIDDLFLGGEPLEPDAYLAMLTSYRETLMIQTASPSIPPLDSLEPGRVETMLSTLRREFDHVIIDMPATLPRWSEAVLKGSDRILLVTRLGVREARNMSKIVETLEEAEIDFDIFEPVLNFAPTTLGMVEKSKARKFEGSVGHQFQHWLPDGGREVTRALDAGAPLAELARRNPLRLAIQKMAQTMLREAKPRAGVGAAGERS